MLKNTSLSDILDSQHNLPLAPKLETIDTEKIKYAKFEIGDSDTELKRPLSRASK